MSLRMPSHGVVGLLLAALATSGFAEGARPPRYSSSSSSDEYRVLIRSNMFLKNRANAVDETTPGAAQATTPAQITVLTGVVQQDGQYIAFLEDIRTNVTTKARVGDALCDGRVSHITMDSIDYAHNGVSTRVEIGKNLEGVDKTSLAPAVVPAASSASEEAVAPAAASRGAPAAAPLPPEVILERMRQKRLKEMGR